MSDGIRRYYERKDAESNKAGQVYRKALSDGVTGPELDKLYEAWTLAGNTGD